ncbi:unnamed protein product [Adineta ricciae]|uniref:Uncharacterized protein n=1 Tax=Adineta ricciae TaxID=249248 RepID=A0A813MP39_ADIRI|nr:unnamed protein product [Adineta ricciae]CAF0908615.1 unnamed protein product [Adineta ricciae]
MPRLNIFFYSVQNIGAWPSGKHELTDCYVQSHETLSENTNELFWTKSFLQTSPYDDQRYRQIASNACQRIIRMFFRTTDKPSNFSSFYLEEESKAHSSQSTSNRPPSTIAISLSETSTRQTTHSTSQATTLPTTLKKQSSHTRFSCYLKSHSKQTRKTHCRTIIPKNNNHYQAKTKSLVPKQNATKLTTQCRERMCSKCLNLIRKSSTCISSSVLCQPCLDIVRNSNNMISIKRLALNKTEENELRHIIEIVIEEFQNYFGQALTLSIKQMTQHLLSNVNLFYNHYRQEFEQLTKKYRLAFLERFIQLMNKLNSKNIKQTMKSSLSERASITRPPNIVSMSSLSGSLGTEKDRCETITQLISPSNSMSISTTSNRSIVINEKVNLNSNRKCSTLQNSSSKKTFTTTRSNPKPLSNKVRKHLPPPPSSSSSSTFQLIDAYRFRETLRASNAQFRALRPKLQ